jgi:hypothetical protein
LIVKTEAKKKLLLILVPRRFSYSLAQRKRGNEKSLGRRKEKSLGMNMSFVDINQYGGDDVIQ